MKHAGLKIRLRRLHQNAASRKPLKHLDLAFPLAEPSCTKTQRNERNPALNPALNFGVSRFAGGTSFQSVNTGRLERVFLDHQARA
jgi:hypothetical protein